MAYKMKELMALSDVSKSTILYYVKEGLLPEPSRPKPNVHLYDESCVQILKFIKYLQHNFSYTISEIKSIFEDNRFDFDGSFEMMVRSLELISGTKDNQWYSKEEFLTLLDMDEETLRAYQVKGYLFERAKGFSSKEVEVAKVLQRAYALGLDCSLLDAYVADAKVLAKKENEIGSKLLKDDSKSHDERYELLFDLVLTLKPYIFNMHTVETHKKIIKKES
ncbi:MerR family transcriptional regulator [Sulfurovum sp. NBC37-1]|uniref:MerR family transcriptional regulator n=1 Tax=Sulfurovum sp. (strain NBC37-1) TaxID=387093 RepID=UPI0001587532|nr:MerR family transcriptional regulator [Sulfurovum sp. NBC37-1]BAF72120.1 transcriptional regulator, MerR family [Sulfurovum sp. NBC37-1]